MKKVLVLAGPTASGKSELALQLAIHYQGAILNADSQQVYTQLNIGTAKPTLAERQTCPHFGFDVVDYDQPFHVKAYQDLARRVLKQCHKDNVLPIMVGGTGLYLKASLFDYQFEDEPLHRISFDELSPLERYNLLKQLDPEAALKIHPNNQKRVLRALQLAHQPRNKSTREAQQSHKPLYDVMMVVVDRQRDHLHQRIQTRVEQMFEDGLKAEVMHYFSEPHQRTYQSFQAIGYKEWKAYFEHAISEAEVMNQIVIATRQYAKRQYTWFRHQFQALWFNLDESSIESLIAQIDQWLEREKK